MANESKNSKKWEEINKSRSERPEVQQYDGYEDLPPIPISFPIKGAIGNTGDWRTYRPVINHEKCTKCGQCYILCPEGVVQKDANDFYEIDLLYCKGCGICAKHCPVEAINMELEDK